MGVPLEDLITVEQRAALRAAAGLPPEDGLEAKGMAASSRHRKPTMPTDDDREPYPIGNLEDLNNAIQAWGRSKPDERSKLKRWLLRRARELDAGPSVVQRVERLNAGGTMTKGHDDVDDLEVKDPAELAGALEHKNATGATQVISADDDTGVVEALVSVTGVEDRVKDIIEPGAFTKTMAEREPIGVWSHDDKTWVARTEEAVELRPGDPFFKGLTTMDGAPWPAAAGAVKVKARFNLETPHGKAAYSDVKFFQGKTGWSIGYRATKAHRNPRTGVRHIKELGWYEYSPVMVGAASQPMTLSVKSLAQPVDAAEETGFVDDGVLEQLSEAEVKAYHDLRESLGLEVKDRVRTAAGQARFGQPIGSVIIPDTLKGKSSLSDADLAGMIRAAQAKGEDDEVRILRGVAGLPPEKRAAALTGKPDGGEKPAAGAAPAAKPEDSGPAANVLVGTRFDAFIDEYDGSDSELAEEVDAAGELPLAQAHEKLMGIARKLPDGDPKRTAVSDIARRVEAEIAKRPQVRRGSTDYGPPPEGVKPAAWEAANNESLDGLDPDDPKFRSVADREGIDKDDLVEAATAIEQADPARKPKAAAAPKAGGGSSAASRPAGAGRKEGRSDGGKDYGIAPLKAGASSTEKAQHSGRVRDKAKEIAPVGTMVKIGNTEYRVSGHTMTSVEKSYNNEKGDKVDVGLQRLNDRGMVAGRTSTRTTLEALEKAVVKRPESRNPEAARERDQRADKTRSRERGADVAANARTSEREKLAAYNRRRRARGQAPVLRLPDSMKSLDLAATPDDELDAYADSDPTTEEFKGDLAGWDAYPDALEVKGSRASLDRSPKANWVENTGELPGYIREVARAIERDHGVPLSRAIPMAIGRVKTWARGGGDVNADTVAKAAKAVAEWEALKAKARAKFDSTLLAVMESKGLLDDDDDAGDYTWGEFDEAMVEAIAEVKGEYADPDEVWELLGRGAEVKSAVEMFDLFERGRALSMEVKKKDPAVSGGKDATARVVRTAEGSRRYGVPIGQVYTEGKKPERGEAGPKTKEAQELLVRLGLLEPRADGSVHGVFGPKTEAAVRKFQKDNGLPETGELDDSTMESLRKETPGDDRAGAGGSAANKPASGSGSGSSGGEAPAKDRAAVRSWFESLPAETRKRVAARAREILKAEKPA